MNETTAPRWAYATAATGMIANGLFVAFYVGFTLQDFGDPHGVAAALGSAADYAGIPQNALLAVFTVVVYRFLSPQRRFDRVLQVIGALACVAAVISGVLTVTGVLPGGPGVLAVGAVAVSAVWLLVAARRLAWLPGLQHARAAAWLGQLLALTMLAGGAVAGLGFGIGLGPLVWAAVAVGCLAWLAIPVWVLIVGRALARSREYWPISQATLSPAA
jgi:hypothetical protein